MQTIDQDARVGIRQPFEIDNMCPRYRTNNGLFILSSPAMEVLDKYFYYLLSNSRVDNFDQKYSTRPSYLSYDEYGTVNLEYLLMYVNGVYLPEEFILSDVIIPTMAAIVYICQDKYSTDKSLDSYETILW